MHHRPLDSGMPTRRVTDALRGAPLEAAMALLIAMDQGVVPVDVVPASLRGRGLTDWFRRSGWWETFDAAMDARAVPVLCPSWCTSGHDFPVLRPDRAYVRHHLAFTIGGDLRVDLLLGQYHPEHPEYGPPDPDYVPPDDRPHLEVDAGGDDEGPLTLTDPVLVRRLALTLLKAADRLEDAQVEDGQA